MITNIILIVTVGLSLLAFKFEELMQRLIFNPYRIEKTKEFYRFLSSGFIHADYMHLLINGFVLYSFGAYVESAFEYYRPGMGWLFYLLLYLIAIVLSSTPSYMRNRDLPHYNALGASGGVSAVVFASILLNPTAKIYLFGVIGAPGYLLGLAYLGYSYYADKKGGGRINHSAHFAGAIFGLAFTAIVIPEALSQLKDIF